MRLAALVAGNAGEPLIPALRDRGAKAGFVILSAPIVNRCFRQGFVDLELCG